MDTASFLLFFLISCCFSQVQTDDAHDSGAGQQRQAPVGQDAVLGKMLALSARRRRANRGQERITNVLTADKGCLSYDQRQVSILIPGSGGDGVFLELRAPHFRHHFHTGRVKNSQ